jgi:peptide/nickel transport system substrate-binding protein
VSLMTTISVACTGSHRSSERTVLHAALLYDLPANLDPQRENYNVPAGLFRCCLLRTLLSYRGQSGEPGLELAPDLATSYPSASSDGLIWTFRLRSGIRYGPPFQTRDVVSHDIIRALERELDPQTFGGYPADYEVIEGASSFRAGRSDRIRGLTAPDDHTLEVRLSHPAGELPYLFALAASAPLPAGAADGHREDYGRFLVSTGPYMLEGSDRIDPTLPPNRQVPPSGYRPGRSLVLVRNPSWDPSTDPIRPAAIDRIEIQIGGEQSDLELKVDKGELDLILDVNDSPKEISTYASDPNLRDRLFVDPTEALVFDVLNVATPPFDDAHVRRAVNLAIDRDGLLRVSGGSTTGIPSQHLVPGPLEGGELSDFHPFSFATRSDAIEAARIEMSRSRYDTNDDGRCDVSCSIVALSPNDPQAAARAVVTRDDLSRIGLGLDVREREFGAVISTASIPDNRVQMTLSLGWFGEFPNASTYLLPLFHSSALSSAGTYDMSMLGATSSQLRSWGYSTSSVPSADALLDRCIPLFGGDQAHCWAEADRRLMTRIDPLVPLYWTNTVHVVSERVAGYELDQASLFPALDQMSIVSSSA